MNKPTEPSAAEVERIVAEQYANLPSWWVASGLRDDNRQGKPCDNGGRPKRLRKPVRKRSRTG